VLFVEGKNGLLQSLEGGNRKGSQGALRSRKCVLTFLLGRKLKDFGGGNHENCGASPEGGRRRPAPERKKKSSTRGFGRAIGAGGPPRRGKKECLHEKKESLSQLLKMNEFGVRIRKLARRRREGKMKKGEGLRLKRGGGVWGVDD